MSRPEAPPVRTQSNGAWPGRRPGDTPAAHWREREEPDPHRNAYDCPRSRLTLGDLSDDELANAVFLYGNGPLDLEGIVAGTAHPPIAYLQAAKDRIRWLSRRLQAAQDQPTDSSA